MKRISIALIAIFTLFLSSCEEKEVLYDGSQTLAYFQGNGQQLAVPIDEQSATITIPINVSTLSDSDRTINISVNEARTTATPDMYTFQTSVVIPADTYFTSFEIQGLQNNLSQEGDLLTLQIDSVDDGGVGSPTNYEVLIIQTCPFVFDRYIGTFSQFGRATDDGTPGPRPDVVVTQGPEDDLLLVTNVWATGRQMMIQLDSSNPNNPAVIHRSEEFDAVFADFGLGSTYTEDILGRPADNVYNSCNTSFKVSFNRRIAQPDGRFYSGTYTLEFIKL